MRHSAHLLLLASLALVQTCFAAQADGLPLTVGGGLGSEIGNYGLALDGEFINSYGQHCKVYNWDRPLNEFQVLRVRSASCPGGYRPGSMMGTEIDRRIIPMAQSHLRFLPPEPGRTGALALADTWSYPRGWAYPHSGR